MATAVTTEDKKPVRSKAATTKNATKPANASAATREKAPARTTAAKSAKAPAGTTARRAKPPVNRQSRDSSMTGKEHDDHVARIWELAKRIGIAMFVTWDGKEQRARPLAATIEKDEGAIYFLTDINGEKDDQIAEFPHVSVSFADHKSSKYVALSGKATISNDRARIKELWSPFAKAWWDSPEDPAIRVIRMVPNDAELWDSPGRIVTTISMLTAVVTGRSPKIGENAKVVM
jgi:general stress protein 26